jgi:hypothetical protein
MTTIARVTLAAAVAATSWLALTACSPKATPPPAAGSTAHRTVALSKASARQPKAAGAPQATQRNPSLPASACSLVSVAQMGQLTGLGEGMIDPNSGIGANAQQRDCTYLFHGGVVDVILTGGTTAADFRGQQANAVAHYSAVPMSAEVGVPAFATEDQNGGTGVAALDGHINVLVTSIAPVTATAVLHIAATVVGALG